MAKIVVLGAGLVGNVMAKDLAKQHAVTSVDISKQALATIEAHNIQTLRMTYQIKTLYPTSFKILIWWLERSLDLWDIKCYKL